MQLYIPEISITETLALQLLQQFPEINVQQIKKLGEGWDNAAYLINNEVVFRFPQREVSVPLLVLENSLLPQLANRFTLQIPNPIYIGHEQADYPWVFSGYKKLSGISGCQLDLSNHEYSVCAKALGKFLRQLHDLDITQLDIGTPPYVNKRTDKRGMQQYLQTRWQEVSKKFALHSFLSLRDEIIKNIENVNLESDELCLIHGDLYHRHLLFNNKKLTGIIDWGDIAFSHYIVDLAVIYQFLPPLAHADFFTEYGAVPKDLLAYARFLGLYYAVTLLWYGSGINDKRLIETSFKTLNWLLSK